MALPKKYFKMYPGNLKKAWAKYRSDKKKRASGGEKKKTTKKRSTTMAKKKTTRKTARKYASAAKTRIVRRTRELKPGELVMRALVASAGGIVSSLIVNRAPFVAGLDTKLKSAAQMGVGLGSLYFLPKKFKMLKMLGVGAFTAGAFGLVQKVTNQQVLAGDTVLNEEEVAALMQNGYSMAGPVNMGALAGPTDLGAGENPAFMGAMNPAFMGAYDI